MTRTREPAVAGRFYPAKPHELRAALAAMLDETPAVEPPAPKALIAPHAGYEYSGAVAASAYAVLRRHRERYRRVVLFGPSHRMVLHGAALSGADAFQTPLGEVPVDRAAVARLERHGVPASPAAHAREHSLEVQLPFLQALLDEFTLVPLVVGEADPDEVARLLDLLWDGPETLVVISSDLSHYLAYEDARTRDAATCRAIERFEHGRIGDDDACGAGPIRGLLLVAKQRNVRITTLDLRNSGDTAGGMSRVVGYGAWTLAEDGAMRESVA